MTKPPYSVLSISVCKSGNSGERARPLLEVTFLTARDFWRIILNGHVPRFSHSRPSSAKVIVTSPLVSGPSNSLSAGRRDRPRLWQERDSPACAPPVRQPWG